MKLFPLLVFTAIALSSEVGGAAATTCKEGAVIQRQENVGWDDTTGTIFETRFYQCHGGRWELQLPAVPEPKPLCNDGETIRHWESSSSDDNGVSQTLQIFVCRNGRFELLQDPPSLPPALRCTDGARITHTESVDGDPGKLVTMIYVCRDNQWYYAGRK